MPLRLIQCCIEFIPKKEIRHIGAKRRGIYVLYNHFPNKRQKTSGRYDVVYIGMTDASIRVRLRSHARKKKDWTDFSVYAVWPNVTKEEIGELEGLFRHIYRLDEKANALNIQRKYKALRGITAKNLTEWRERTDFSRK